MISKVRVFRVFYKGFYFLKSLLKKEIKIQEKTELSNIELEFLNVEKQLETIVKEAKLDIKYNKVNERFNDLMKREEI
ncbi:hypothetical protein [uncultured Tenacibaculum sp.]|uniref:hypothetical protein n=1 Tax=uncultured Tenacibaculum sp. TaxID=174713 RepID=UPI0026283C8E|nr:hypothetical protein [uncultured Tenacibaculum sp.]